MNEFFVMMMMMMMMMADDGLSIVLLEIELVKKVV